MLSEKKGVLDAYSEESFWALSTQYLIPTFSLVYTFTVPPNDRNQRLEGAAPAAPVVRWIELLGISFFKKLL